FIANGDILEVSKIKRITEMHGFRFADIIARFPDYELEEIEVKIILDTLSIDGPSLAQAQHNQLFQSVFADYSDLKRKSSIIKKVKSDPYFNALQVKFAYAVTCHKAQGGQWKEVYLDQGYIPDLIINKEYLRWIYTAITRSYSKLYLVNFSDDFF
ncbi:MAG: ATP-binding domain-containing protein, partial [Bacteroidales bacterium]|nr:ATP-binding domain-containing protein [Bacteroidales bacterium]